MFFRCVFVRFFIAGELLRERTKENWSSAGRIVIRKLPNTPTISKASEYCGLSTPKCFNRILIGKEVPRESLVDDGNLLRSSRVPVREVAAAQNRHTNGLEETSARTIRMEKQWSLARAPGVPVNLRTIPTCCRREECTVPGSRWPQRAIARSGLRYRDKARGAGRKYSQRLADRIAARYRAGRCYAKVLGAPDCEAIWNTANAPASKTTDRAIAG